MSREAHAGFCESGRGRLPPATHLVILCVSRIEARAADHLVRHILADMGLEVAEAKSGVRRVADGFEFLGFSFKARFLRPRPQAVARFKDRVRALTARNAPVSLGQMIADLNPLLRGWGHYYGIGNVAELFRRLDQWIRMRLRSKVRGRRAQGLWNYKLTIRAFTGLGLVSLVDLHANRLSPVPGHSLG